MWLKVLMASVLFSYITPCALPQPILKVTLDGNDLNQLAADSDSLTSTMLFNPPPRPVNALRRVSRQEHEKLIETILKAAVELRDTCDDRFLCDEEAS